MLFNFGQLIFIVLLRPFRKCHHRIFKYRERLKRGLMWNFLVRLLMETALELSFCCFLNAPYFYRVTKVGGFFEGIDYFMTAIIGVLIAIMPFWVAIFYNINFEKMGDLKFESKFGAIYEGLQTDNRWCIANSVLFMVRRIALAATCIYLYESIWLQ
jgi:hypothetical protein